MRYDNVPVVNPGDEVILVDDSCKPTKTVVEKQTNAGWLRIPEIPSAVKPDGTCCNLGVFSWRLISIGRFHDKLIYQYTAELMEKLEAIYTKMQAIAANKKAEELNRQKEREAADARKMVKTKAACGGNFITRQRMVEQLPDGRRLYVINVPVKAEIAKPDYLALLFVLCGDHNDSWDRDRPDRAVKYNFTWCGGSTDSFASCSSAHAASDEDALWVAIDYCYHHSIW